MSSDEKDVEDKHPKQKYVAPDFKRRQLIFDSFTKLKQPFASRGQFTHGSPKGTLLYAWGAGYNGQLGLSSYRKKCKFVPALISFKEPVLQVSCGGFHTAVLTDSGRVYTWGDGRMGQLGNLARKHNMHATPHIVDKLATFEVNVVQIACGQYHTSCVSAKGDLYTWGSGKYGQLGHATRLDERYPRRVNVDQTVGQITHVACGDRHTCAVTKRCHVVTFGSGQHGQLGHGNGWDYLKPKIVEALTHTRVRYVAGGATTTAAITETGVMYLWGFGESIHPKHMDNIVDSPRVVRMKERVKQVAMGQSHIIVLTESGNVYSFGSSGMGQLGHGSNSNIRKCRIVLKGKEIFEIAAGRYHSMAITAYGVLYSWGCGESGQLAHGNLKTIAFPKLVEALLPNVVGQIAAGEHHSMCLSSIQHATISQDVLNWKMIEDEELKLKMAMLKELPNGLKTQHILQVEQERARIIREISEHIAREQESERVHLQEQISSISQHAELLKDVQETTRKREAMKPQLARGNKGARSTTALKLRTRPKRSRQSLPVTERTDYSNVVPPTVGGVNEKGDSVLGKSRSVAVLPGGAGWRGRSPRRPVTSTGRESLVFQPLQHRVRFVEETTKMLSRVKRDLQTSQQRKRKKPDMGSFFKVKNRYNEFRAIAQEKTKKLDSLRNSYVFMRPTEEDITRQSKYQLRIKELNMKLVTLNTRLMEAEENKKNYELYIIRMKEEDVTLSKQIDHLRRMVVEYDRLLQKMDTMNVRVVGQRAQIMEEIQKFQKDIIQFEEFSKQHIDQCKELISRSRANARVQEKVAADRDRKIVDKQRRRLMKLQEEFEMKAKEALDIKEELQVWQDKVSFYEQRFHKITAATGLSRPEDIVNKFFINDEITEDLNSEILLRKRDIEKLQEEKSTLERALSDGKVIQDESKWRDLDKMQELLSEENLKLTRLSDNVDRVNQKLALVHEGIVALVYKLDDRPPKDQEALPHGESAVETVLPCLQNLEQLISTILDKAAQARHAKGELEEKEKTHGKPRPLALEIPIEAVRGEVPCSGDAEQAETNTIVKKTKGLL